MATALGAANPIDLRVFYTISPGLNVQLPTGATRVAVDFTSMGR